MRSLSSKVFNICPSEGASCMIILNSVKKLPYPTDEEFEFHIGEVNSALDNALDSELVKLRAGESAVIKTPETGRDISDDNDAPSNSSVAVKLVSFENVPMFHQLTQEQKFKIASQHKAKGVDLFKTGNLEYALKRFSKALHYLILMLPSSDIPVPLLLGFNNLRAQCYANLSACQIKAGSYEYVVENCTKALAIQPDNIKCVFRRATANFMLKNFDACKLDVQTGLALEPNSKSFKQLGQKLFTG